MTPAAQALVQVQVRPEDGAAIITLCAPERRNALSTAMRNDLLDALRALTERDDVHALVLTGAGGHFSSGGDISEMAPPGEPMDVVRARRRIEALHACVRLLVGGPKPVVAAVEGSVFGGGLSLAAACDWVVATEDARFSAVFGKLGMIADCGLLWTLPRRIGEPAARDLLLTARVLDASEALGMRVIDEVVPRGQAVAHALKKCAQYRAVAPLAIAGTKSILARAPASLNDLLQAEIDVQQGPLLSRDHEEARRAFLEKRAAVFVGR